MNVLRLKPFHILNVTVRALPSFLFTLSPVCPTGIVYVLGSRSHSQLFKEPPFFSFLTFFARAALLALRLSLLRGREQLEEPLGGALGPEGGQRRRARPKDA